MAVDSAPSEENARYPIPAGNYGGVVNTSTSEAYVDLSAHVGKYVSFCHVGAAGEDALVAQLRSNSGSNHLIVVTAGTTVTVDRPVYATHKVPFDSVWVVRKDRPYLTVKTEAGTGRLFFQLT